MEQKVKDFNNNRMCHQNSMPVYARILDIQSELGELAKEYLNNSKYGTGDFCLSEEFELEYGDVMYSLLSLAQELDLSSEKCVDKVLQKYQKRIDKNKSMGSEN